MSSAFGGNGHHPTAAGTKEADMSAPPSASSAPAQPDDDAFDAATALMRLLIGATLEGIDEFMARLRQWDATVRSAQPELARGDTLADLRRYALIGIAFKLRQRVSHGMSAVARLSDQAANAVMAAFAPVLRRTPLDPLLEYLSGRYREVYREWLDTLDDLTALGRLEEQEARLMARQALPGLMEQALDFVTKNPEVRALLEQQGAEVAKSALDEARERVGTADVLAERVVHSLLRRPKPNDAPPRQPARGNPPTADVAHGADGAR